MREMTSRERLTRIFDGRETDRTPVWLLTPFHPIGCYVDIYNNPYYKDIVKYQQKYCDIFDRRSYDKGFCYNANPDIKSAGFRQADASGIRTGTRTEYKNIVFEHYTERGPDITRVKYRVQSADALADILSIPYVPPEPDISAYSREKEELGSCGLMMTDIGDPLGPLYQLMSAEDFSVATLTDYDKLLEFTDEMHRRVYSMYKYMLEHEIGDVFFIVGAEFAGPPLVSPAKFRELSVRYVKNIVDLIRSYGKKSIVHYHGQLKQVLEGMREINPDGLHTIEAPPTGDCPMDEARSALGDMILIGNIQYDDLTRAAPERIRELVKTAFDGAAGGRFILSPTAGPYENEINRTTQQNYIELIRAGIQYGGGIWTD